MTLNPFLARADAARAKADAINRPTAHERGMAAAFPLGAGFGRTGSAKRVEASVSRAVKAVDAENRARYLEAQAATYDRGEINAQGHRVNAASLARSAKRSEAKASREARIEAARAAIEGRDPLDVPAETWADAHGYLGGSGRALVIASHRERVAQQEGGAA